MEKHTGHQWLPTPFLGKTFGCGWGLSPSLIKVGRSFFLPQGTARSSQSQPAGSQRLGARVLDFYIWLPPPRQKQVPARLQVSPQRGTAQREELAPRLLAINLLLCPGRFPSETCQPAGLRLAPLLGHRPAIAPPGALEHPGQPPGADALPALLPRAGKPDSGSRGPGTSRGKSGQWWWPAGGTGRSAILGSRG